MSISKKKIKELSPSKPFSISINDELFWIRKISFGDLAGISSLIKLNITIPIFLKKLIIHQLKDSSQEKLLDLLDDSAWDDVAHQFINNHKYLKKFIPEEVKKPSEQLHEALKRDNAHREEYLNRMAQQISANFYSSAHSILHQIQPQLDLAQQIIQQFQPVFLQLSALQNLVSSFSESFSGIQHNFLLLREKEKYALRLLKRQRWFITPDFSIPFVMQLAEIEKNSKNKVKDVNDLFDSYFLGNNAQELKHLLSRWKKNNLLAKRYKILSDCVELLIKKDKISINASNVLIPTLFAQIDGIITDYLESKGISKNSNGWFDVQGNPVNWKDEFSQIPINDSLTKIGISVLIDVLFQWTDNRQNDSLPKTFSRHRVLHGMLDIYGYKTNVLRAILIIDLFCYLP